MSVIHEFREVHVKPTRTLVPVGAVCDACGEDCWYSAHNRPTAILSRVEDGERGNMDIWNLDLCGACKDSVIDLLQRRAAYVGRVLPNDSVDVTR